MPADGQSAEWRDECRGFGFSLDILPRHFLYVCDLTDIFVRRVLLVSDRAYHGLRDHRAVLAALRTANAGEAERLHRLTVANICAAVERYSAFVV